MAFVRLALLAVFACVHASAAHALTVEDLRKALELGAPDQGALERGKLETVSAPEFGERDLAVGYFQFLPTTPEVLARGFRDGLDLKQGPNVVAVHRLASFTVSDFAPLQLLASTALDEAARYRKARAGDDLNLSREEIAVLQQLGDLAGPTKVAGEVKRLLLARIAAYRASGLAGIAPYLREGGAARSPGEELRALISRVAARLDVLAPGIGQALLGYPRTGHLPVEESFFWIAYESDGRPTYTLRHRMTLKINDGVVAVDREIYVSHGYDDMQAVALAFPARAGTVVAYRAHTFTDRVAGVGSVAKHGVGRRMLSTELEKMFERTRARVAK